MLKKKWNTIIYVRFSIICYRRNTFTKKRVIYYFLSFLSCYSMFFFVFLIPLVACVWFRVESSCHLLQKKMSVSPTLPRLSPKSFEGLERAPQSVFFCDLWIYDERRWTLLGDRWHLTPQLCDFSIIFVKK